MIEIEQLLPYELTEEYWDNTIVNAIFDSAAYRDMTREQALVMCVKYLCQDNKRLFKEVTTSSMLRPPSIIFSKEDLGE